ncbi:MAG: carboxypeptidase-like regulatory domain-containing protein [Gemmataceae bacterium]
MTKSSTLQVEITPKTSDAAKFTDVPAKVRLDLRPQANPDLELEKAKGTFEADLPLDGKATLFVENVKYQTAPDKKIRKDNIQDSNSNFSVVGISIDGYERAFLLKTNFEGTPVPLTGPYANVLLSSKMQTPGKPVQVSVETNNLSGKDVKFEVDRVGDGKSFELIRNYKGTTRQNVIYLKTGGENDAIVLNPVSKDESIDFATANVIGKRSFRIEAVSKSETQAEPIVANGELIIDKTAPYDVQLSNVPSKKELVVDSEMKLQAVGKDDESGIRKVFFYVGEAPNLDGKAVPGGKVVEGVVVDEGAKPGVPQVATFRVKEPLRLPGAKGETKIGVLYVNGVGLGTISEQTIFVTEAEVPKKKTTGSIEGRVVQGTRAQPGLPVTLSDATGKVVVKSATSDADGKFKFEELAPGTYTVSAVKKADANAKGSKTVTVEASDKPATVEINILR